MARCRTCSRELQSPVTRNGRLLFICRCADRTEVKCDRCHEPFRDVSIHGDSYVATCSRCFERVVLDQDGIEVERRRHEKVEPTAPTPSEPEPDEETPSFIVRRERDPRGGYRSHGQTVEIERLPRHVPLPDGFGVGCVTTLFGAGLAFLTFFTMIPDSLVLGGSLALVIVTVGAILGVCVGAVVPRLAKRRTTRAERTDRTVRLFIGDEEIEADPREDENWDGRIALDRVTEVRLVDGEGGMRRVRVALDDGTERTVMDGLLESEEAAEVVGQLERALEIRRARRGST